MSEPRGDEVFEFPCDFPIKVFGPAVAGFPGHVLEQVRRHAPDTPETAIRCKASRGGRYFSVTVTVRARSRAQLDAIYRRLGASEQVIMVL